MRRPGGIMGFSGGAVSALALVRAHPEQVHAVIAHEPPLSELLDDREQIRAQIAEYFATYLAGDVAGTCSGTGLPRFLDTQVGEAGGLVATLYQPSTALCVVVKWMCASAQGLSPRVFAG